MSPDVRRILAIQALRACQMDVPARQAYVVTVVDPSERTAAAAHTNTARYMVQPAGPLVAGAALHGTACTRSFEIGSSRELGRAAA